MKNLIFNAYAYIENYNTSVNIINSKKNIFTYLKNSFVSLKSAQISNPEYEAALVTNIKVSEEFKKFFLENNIKIYFCPFDYFRFEQNYKWALAFFKLCALKYVVDLEYDNYLLLDTDTYVQSSLEDMFEECKTKILLYDIQQRLTNEDCRIFNQEYNKLSGKYDYPTNYGGEFLAGNRNNLLLFVTECENIYKMMQENDFKTSFGDEFIIRLAANNMRLIIKNANAYVYRYWNRRHYLISTNYKFDAVSVLHFPNEKNDAMIRMFNYYRQKNKFPKKNKVYKWFLLDLKLYIFYPFIWAIKKIQKMAKNKNNYSKDYQL